MSFITVDRTGAPLLHVDALKLEVQLLPVTKPQFEAFLAERNQFGDRWYEELLEVNPRCSWRDLREEVRQQAFLTGIRPAEAGHFADWLGDGFRLPSVDEWQSIYRLWLTRTERFPAQVANSSVERMVRVLLEASSPRPLVELSRMHGGVLEWVTGKRGWQLLGQPGSSAHPNLFAWRHPVFPANTDKRCGLFGFRLVRTV